MKFFERCRRATKQQLNITKSPFRFAVCKPPNCHRDSHDCTSGSHDSADCTNAASWSSHCLLLCGDTRGMSMFPDHLVFGDSVRLHLCALYSVMRASLLEKLQRTQALLLWAPPPPPSPCLSAAKPGDQGFAYSTCFWTYSTTPWTWQKTGNR